MRPEVNLFSPKELCNNYLLLTVMTLKLITTTCT